MIPLRIAVVVLILTIVHTAHSFTKTVAATNTTPETSPMSSSRLSAAAANGVASNLKVAVIGGGAAGLVTARVLQRNGIEATIFEKDDGVGGVWSYHQNSASRPMYRGLRTNLPRELMAYREFPWGGDGKTRSFVTHKDVKEYLQSYSKAMGLEDLIRYGSTVTQLEVLDNNEHKESKSDDESDWPQIRLEWETKTRDKTAASDSNTNSQVFDAVCVCNGHYAAPATPVIPGMEHFKGKSMHSIAYDDPSIFDGQTVLCVGGRASGADLAREISFHAKHVYLSDTTCPSSEITEENVSWVPKTTEVLSDGTISFGPTCDTTPNVDTIVFCSGYDYQFPFINGRSNLDLSVLPGERRVKPLYKQLWHPRIPSLTFIGLQHSVVPFPFFELQAEAVASQLLQTNDQWTLPPLEERLSSAEEDANGGGPKEPGRVQDTHFLGSYQWEECLKYARFAGICDESLKKYIATNKAIYDHSGEERKTLFPGGPDTYRYNSYVRDDENESFRVVSLLHEMDATAQLSAVETS
jgi:thioredoxin reductase